MSLLLHGQDSRPTTTVEVRDIVRLSLPTVILCIAVLACSMLRAPAQSVRYVKQRVNNALLHLVYVDLRDPSVLVTPGVAQEVPGKRLSFPEFMEVNQPLAQCTGTFFDFRSGEAIGDLVVHGELIHSSTGMGTALAITPDNRAVMFEPLPGEVRDWSPYESVMQGGVRLIRHGMSAVDPDSQGFHDKYMCRRTHRIAVGLLSEQRLVLLGTFNDLFLPELADIMLKLGCREAMALDGGGSTAFAHHDTRVFTTYRKLANVLMVVRRPYDPVAALNAFINARNHIFPTSNEELLEVPLVPLADTEEEVAGNTALTSSFSALPSPPKPNLFSLLFAALATPLGLVRP